MSNGVLADGGGIIFVGGHPVPVPPWNPETRDLDVGVAVLRLAEQLSDAKARAELQTIARRVVERSISPTVQATR